MILGFPLYFIKALIKPNNSLLFPEKYYNELNLYRLEHI